MKHIHHIIPKHMGGSDDLSNLIELSIKDHAEAHRLLYEKYGKIQDYYAWQGLIRNVKKEDIFLGLMKSKEIREKISNGVQNHWNNLTEEEKIIRRNQFLEIRKLTPGSKGKNWKLSEETRKKQSKPKSEDHKKNISKSLKGKRIGKDNPCFGSIWITNETSTIKINNQDAIPDGWRMGRAFKKRNKRLAGN